MKKKLKNLLSRKFLATAAVTMAGIGTALSQSTTPKVRIVGLFIAAVTTIVYNFIEGRIDAKSVYTHTKELIETIENSTATYKPIDSNESENN